MTKLCEDCGNPDGKCGNCGRMHHPAIENGRCEGCKNEPVIVEKKEPDLAKRIRADIVVHCVSNGEGLSAYVYNVELTSKTGAWSAMFTTTPERDAFLEGVKAASRLLGRQEPTLASHTGRSFQFARGGAELNEEERVLLRRGKKIEAIKALRVRTGMGLKEAKDACDRG